jgi:hypothetical protein
VSGYSYGSAYDLLDERVHVFVSRWFAQQRGYDENQAVCGQLYRLTEKAVGLAIEGSDGRLAWFPLSQIERIERCLSSTGGQRREQRNAPPPPSQRRESPYDVLGVPTSASTEEIRAAYRALMKALHPDLNPARADPTVAAVLNSRAAAVNAAFAALDNTR